MKLTRIQEIMREVEELHEEMAGLQERCNHPGASRRARGDSGNIMTGRDASYWYEYECSLCFKKWSAPQ